MIGLSLISQSRSTFSSLCGGLDGNCKIVDWCPGPGKWATVHQKAGNLLLHSHILGCTFLYMDLKVTKTLGLIVLKKHSTKQKRILIF